MKNPFSRTPRLVFLLLFFAGGLFLFLWRGLPGGKEELPFHARFPGKVSEILGRDETCLDCHSGMTGFAPAHDPQVIGCSPCHRGNPRAAGKRAAHRGLIAVPGNLDDAFLTCGTKYCHQDITVRVKRSLMSTMSGVVTVDRFVFGEVDSLTGLAHIQALSMDTPADLHLRHLCASCHLGNKKTHPGPLTESSRGGGCNACHLNYSEEARRQLGVYHAEGELPRVHPALNLQTGNDKCFGCHSRSGRISTNYEGWHETQLTPEDAAGKTGYRQLADGRIFAFVAADVHHAAGLECVDCHRSRELMGDGRRHAHQEEAVRTQCGDCHFDSTPRTVPLGGLDPESQKIVALRGLPYHGKRFVVGPASGEALLNVLTGEEGEPFLLQKNSGRRHPLPPPADVCRRGPAHDALTCSACHTGWAPQCVGCHTFYDPARQAVDLLDKRRTKGKWVEYLGEFFPEPPSLGIVETLDADSQYVRQVKAFIPGMIMTLDQSEVGSRKWEVGSPEGSGSSLRFDRKPEGASPGGASSHANQTDDTFFTFHRLFAPAAPHTTTRAGRSCESCHNNPLALGYGRGRLVYEPASGGGRWQFIPEYAPSPHDGLPEDAWTGFLRERRDVAATRANARPFSVAEQRRILTVGACLTCHAGASPLMLRALDDFAGTMKARKKVCVAPRWE